MERTSLRRHDWVVEAVVDAIVQKRIHDVDDMVVPRLDRTRHAEFLAIDMDHLV
jgi:hypothetical protein